MLTTTRRKRAALFGTLPILLLLSAIMGIALGPVNINPVRWLMTGSPPYFRDIILSRLPRVAAALMVGGALSVSGTLFQGVFRNPLVEPYTLGVSGGAVLGISLAILAGIDDTMTRSAFAFAGALGGIALVLSIGSRRRDLGAGVILLTGLMFSFISASFLMLIMALARADQMQQIFQWTMGHLGGAPTRALGPFALVILAVSAVAWRLSPALNALSLGEEAAHFLGVRVFFYQRLFIVLGSLLAALAVSLGGVIGFVGLLVPHAMRPFTGPDARSLLPAAFLGGASFLAFSDLIAHTIIAPLVLPVGVITGIVGGSLFVVILYRKSS